MLNIYSKYDSDRLLHSIFRKEDMIKTRIDIAPENQFIQVSALNLHKGKTFRPHQHIWKVPNSKLIITQESWCVISGKVKVFMYDITSELLHTDILNPGDTSITYEGGHNYEILEENSLIYEYKTGPYEGQERDKVFLG